MELPLLDKSSQKDKPKSLNNRSSMEKSLPYLESLEITSPIQRYQKVTSYLKFYLFLDMLPVIRKINNIQRPLIHTDLPPPYENFNIGKKSSLLDRIWAEARRNLPNPSVIWSVAKCFYTETLKSCTSVFFLVTGHIMSSLLLGRIMQIITSSNLGIQDQKDELLFYTIGFAIFYAIGLFFEHYWAFYSFATASSFRLATTSLVYKKINTVSLSSLHEISIGKIINLLANDVNDVEASGFLYPMLVAPYTALLSYSIIWTYFGPYIFIMITIQAGLLLSAVMISNKSIGPRQEKNLITDQRIKSTNEFIENIRLIKLYAWEKPLLKIITSLREKEQAIFKRLGNIDAISRAMTDTSTYICIVVTCIIYVLTGGVLSPEKVYTSIIILSFTRAWVIFFSYYSRMFIISATLMSRRIEDVMKIEEVAPLKKSFDEPFHSPKFNKIDQISKSGAKIPIIFQDYTAYWTKTSQKPCLDNLNLQIENGQFIVLVGRIGSGKTTFLLSFLREIPITSGKLSFNGTLAYVEQEPVIFSGSIRDNIIFGNDFDDHFYHRVLRACNLDDDFRQFDHADQTIVGERGVTLSGGQKARLSLARALYARSDIYLLDDPLSAVDSRVGRLIYDRAIRELLRGKTVILVTHHLSYAKEADKVVVLKDGSIEAEGKLDTLMNRNLDILQIFEEEAKKEEEKHKENKEEKKEVVQKKESLIKNQKRLSSFIEEGLVTSDQVQEIKPEEATVVTKETYINFIKQSQDYSRAILLFGLYCGEQLLIILLTKYIGYWAQLQYTADFLKNSKKSSIDTEPFDNTNHILTVIFLTIIICIVHFIKISKTINFLLDLNTKMHDQMLFKISRTFISFFDETPIGSILNRFSNDLGSLDKSIWNLVYELLDSATAICFSLIYISFLSYQIAVPSLVIVFCLYKVKVYYAHPSIELKRLDLLSRSPLFSMISSTLNGLLIIRVYNQSSRFVSEFMDLVYINSKVFYLLLRTNRIFTFSLQIFLYTLATGGISVIIYIANNTNLDAGILGLALFYFVTIGNSSVWAIRQTINLDIGMQSAQRVQNYCILPEESLSDIAINDQRLRSSSSSFWPFHGAISFKNVYLKYANTDKFALNGLSFDVDPSSKIGIIGRTGAGKSSIIQALFRIVETEDLPNSHIEIDGINIKTLGLSTLRGSLSILPQTPVIFTGTIRRNLDPFVTLSDHHLWEALDQVSLKTYVESLEKGLDTDMSLSSSVFSAGQKQLICMARVILRKSKVVILDEATANVDMVTDSFIQDKINEVFKGCVVITIAHRLSTIAHYDKVLVMDKGMMVEYDHPYKLLVKEVGDMRITNKGGVFAEMLKKNGEKAAQEVFEKAYGAYTAHSQ